MTLACRTMSASYVPFLLGAATIFVLIVWVSWIMVSFPYAGLEWSLQSGQVTALDSQGPAAASGLMISDRIIAFDGASVSSQSSPYLGRAIGSTVMITTLHDGQPSTTSLRLAAPPLREQAIRLEPLLIALVFWSVSLGIWLLRPFHYVTRVFFLLSQTTAGVLAFGNLATIRWPGSSTTFNLLLLLLAPLTLHFYVDFPNPVRPAVRWRLLSMAYGGAALIALVMLSVMLLVEDNARLPFFWSGPQIFVLLVLLLAMVLLFRRSSKDHMSLRRRQRLLHAGMLGSLLPLLVFSFLSELLLGSPVLAYYWTFPFLVFLPITYVYAAREGELGRIDMLLNRSLVYLLLTITLLSFYLLLFLTLYELIPTFSWRQSIVSAGLALLVAALFMPMRAWLQQQIDYLFYGGWYNYRSLVRKTSSDLSQSHDQAHLTAQLMTATKTMRFETGALFWANGLTFNLVECFGVEPAVLSTLRLPIDGWCAQYLRVQARPVWLASIAAAGSTELTPDELCLLALPTVRLCLPLGKHGNVYGILLLGQQQGEPQLDSNDLDILVTLAEQASVAAENITLLDVLRERLAEVEEIRDELTEAQQRLIESAEAERLRLAQDLHDGPVQDLYGARFHMGVLKELVPAAGEGQLLMIQTLLQQVNGSLRNICRELRPPTLVPFGLERAIRSHVATFQETYPNFEVGLDLMPDGNELPDQVRLALFRVCQESLNNIVKHAKAQSILVRLALTPDEIILQIHDDGCGFVVPRRWLDLARQGHLGLLGITERAQVIGGRLEVKSEPNAGTLVSLVVPRARLT